MIPQPFQATRVDIKQGQWTEEMSVQLRDITSCEVTELFINDNHRATLVKEIAHISFTTLICLHLGGNQVESIEGLAHMHMAHMQKIYLRENNITSVGVLRKADWPALRVLSIYYNYFGDGKSLASSSFPQLCSLFVYYLWGEGKGKWIEQCFPAKMQAASLERLSIQKNKFCFVRSTKSALQQRWPDIDIW